MPQIHDVPDDWNPRHRCCLECGNSDPDVTLRALTHPATNQQALACTRHIADVAAVLDSFAPTPQPAAEQAPKLATAPAPSSAPGPRHRSRA
ncbi:hypothetical protein GCM10010211_19710 [Streptomyces albospinus]|uniref:Uncharacterized protein n=1 Tax=Streptomyces albospinus TaxID=285515 RepID=A0ABQ2UUT7_9ACTN|nr:hypothetical protein [Streptomyces albospinus]GGU55085.1 hypothetical protein GCM10010211_19710 [Streptomyces albospinus]